MRAAGAQRDRSGARIERVRAHQGLCEQTFAAELIRGRRRDVTPVQRRLRAEATALICGRGDARDGARFRERRIPGRHSNVSRA